MHFSCYYVSITSQPHFQLGKKSVEDRKRKYHLFLISNWTCIMIFMPSELIRNSVSGILISFHFHKQWISILLPKKYKFGSFLCISFLFNRRAFHALCIVSTRNGLCHLRMSFQWVHLFNKIKHFLRLARSPITFFYLVLRCIDA